MAMLRRAIIALLLRLTPARWRDTVAGDVEEDARGAAGTAWHGTRAIVRLWIEEFAIARADARRRPAMSSFVSHLRQALRSLVKRPGYSLIVIATLAIGIGANASVFTLANWLILRPLPGVTDADRIVTLRFGIGSSNLTISHPEMELIATHVPAVAAIAGSMEAEFNLAAGPAPPERVEGAIVSPNYFDVLGVRHAAGRSFSMSSPGVVISHGYWQTRLGGAGEAVGMTAMVNGRAQPIVGVAPSGFGGMSRSSAIDVWVPSTLKAAVFPGSRKDPVKDITAGVYIELFARLQPGASFDDARVRLDAAKAAIAEVHLNPAKYKRVRINADAGLTEPAYQRERLANVFALLMAMVALLLVLTCANVGNVVLANGLSRRAEIATRQALGASRGRIVTGVILECVLLSLAGGALAVAMAAGIGALMRGTVILPYLAALGDVSMDWRVMTFAFGLSAAAAVGAGLLPALTATRFDLISALKGTSRSVTSTGQRLRKTLLVAQVALSLTLLVGGMLLARSVRARQQIDLGFDAAAVMTFSVEPGLHTGDGPRRRAFYEHLMARVEATPGVEHAALGWSRPFGFIADQEAVKPEGSASEPIEVEQFHVGPGYFETMGLPLLDGRPFRDSDLADRAEMEDDGRAVIVSAGLARRLFGGVNVSGRTIVLSYPEGSRRTIVGVTADARLREPFEPAPDTIYSPLWRDTQWATVHVRLSAPPGVVAPLLRDAVRQADASLPVYDMLTARDGMARRMSEEILVGRLTMAFALIATLLAAVGLYGVLAQSVTERRVEIGIRAALGAAPARVLAMVTFDALRMTALGALAGIAMSLWLGRYIESRLFGVERFDATTFAAALAVVIVTSFIAAVVPAARAARVDPVTALRQ